MTKEEIEKLESGELNTGLDSSIEEPDHVWLGGENSKLEYRVINDSGDWREDAQEEETQKPFSVDWMNCTAQGAMEAIGMQVNFLLKNEVIETELIEEWLIDGRFNGSERALSIASGNTPRGNSLYSVCEAARLQGIVPETILSIPTTNISWSTYHGKSLLTNEVRNWGLKFLKYFDVQFEKVSSVPFGNNVSHSNIQKYLKQSPLYSASATCPGWFSGNEIRRCSATANHAWCIPFDDGKVRVKDSYPNWNRVLASNYLVPYVYRLVITPKEIILKYKTMGKTLAKLGKDKNSNGLSIILPQTSEEALYANLLNHNIEFETKGKPHTVDFGSLKIDAEIDFKDGVVASQKTFMEKLLDLFTK